MTHVSKNKISSEIEKKIVNAFMRSLLSTSAARGRARVHAILTSTEKIMLAKRLAVITMLERSESQYSIARTLNVSTSTISRLDRRRVRGDFDPLCRVFSRHLSFVDYLELFLAAGTSGAGPRHRKRLRALRSGRKPRG